MNIKNVVKKVMSVIYGASLGLTSLLARAEVVNPVENAKNILSDWISSAIGLGIMFFCLLLMKDRKASKIIGLLAVAGIAWVLVKFNVQVLELLSLLIRKVIGIG